MPLNDILAQAIDETRHGPSLSTHEAIEAALPRVKEDEEALDQILREGLGKRIKDMVTKELRKRATESAGQGLLPFDQLRKAYALDTDGRMIKNTDALTRGEWERIREIRRKQIEADTAHLKLLDDVTEMVDDIWQPRPELTFGEVKALWFRSAA